MRPGGARTARRELVTAGHGAPLHREEAMRLLARLGAGRFGNVLAVAVLALAAGPGSSAVAAAPASVLGAYTGYGNARADQAIGAQLGQPLAFGSDYIPYAQGWAGMVSPDIETRWADSGLRMVYGVPMFPASCGLSSASCWNAGAAGSYDGYFSQIARNLVRNGQGNAILRLGWEFNVPKAYAWYAAGYAPQFVRCWRSIVAAMRAVPGAGFTFDWNPNIGSALGDLPAYYPGDGYVGAIGFDVYDMGWRAYPGPQAVWQQDLAGTDGLNWLVSFGAAHGRPLSVPEWGLGITASPAGSGNVGGGDDPVFVDQMATFIASHDVIEAGLWDPGGQFPSAANPAATSALIRDFGSPSGTG
jgi:hypothetical protein